MDLDDLERNTRDGLHVASLAGTWIARVAGLAGMRQHDGTLSFASDLPEGLTRLAFGLVFRGRALRVEATRARTSYWLTEGDAVELPHFGHAITVSGKDRVRCETPAAKTLVSKAPPPQSSTTDPARRAPATPPQHPDGSEHPRSEIMTTRSRSDQTHGPVDLGGYAAWLSDLDVVLTKTTSVHAASSSRSCPSSPSFTVYCGFPRPRARASSRSSVNSGSRTPRGSRCRRILPSATGASA
jgi:hypothetical protein